MVKEDSRNWSCFRLWENFNDRKLTRKCLCAQKAKVYFIQSSLNRAKQKEESWQALSVIMTRWLILSRRKNSFPLDSFKGRLCSEACGCNRDKKNLLAISAFVPFVSSSTLSVLFVFACYRIIDEVVKRVLCSLLFHLFARRLFVQLAKQTTNAHSGKHF